MLSYTQRSLFSMHCCATFDILKQGLLSSTSQLGLVLYAKGKKPWYQGFAHGGST
jgi:hypothetical protein